jgi:hypothetical protein
VESFLSVDFSKAPLSKASRRQLVGIIHAVRQQGGAGRTGLRNLILQNVFDPNRATYVPVAVDFYLKGKLPEISRTLEGEEASGVLTPFPAPLFTNVLLIPPGYGADGFRPDEAPRPLERATNAGFLIVTIEFDCQRLEAVGRKLDLDQESERRRRFRPSPLCRPGPRPAKGKGISRLFHRVQRQPVPALPFYLFYRTPSERSVGGGRRRSSGGFPPRLRHPAQCP